MFEEKVIDFVLELAKVEEKAVTPEELAAEPATPAPAAEPPPTPEAGLRRPDVERAGQPNVWLEFRFRSAYLCRSPWT